MLRLWALLLVFCVGALVAGAVAAMGAGTARATALPRGALLPAGMTRQALAFGGTMRQFLLFRPANLKPGAPVLIVLHGGGQSAAKMFRSKSSPHWDWLALSERDGFLLLAPNGTNPRNGDPAGDTQHWFDLRNRWPAGNPPPDDSGFLAALAGHAVSKYAADPRRVYAAGASNGGMMTFRLLIERPDVFAAGAAFIATLPDRPTPLPVIARPILIAPATEDPVVPWQGGELLRSGVVLLSAADTLRYWLRAHGLADTAPVARYALPDRAPADGCRFEVTAWGGTAAAPLVEFLAIRGGGHWLPSTRPIHLTPKLRLWLGPRCRGMNGPAEAWRFLRQHRLP